MPVGKWTRKNLKKGREVGYPGKRKTLKLKRWEKGDGHESKSFQQMQQDAIHLRGVFVAVTLELAFPLALTRSSNKLHQTGRRHRFRRQNYDNFIITYCGWKDSPTAIRFDPKNDDVTLTGEGWYPVESKAQVDDMIRVMIDRYRFYNGVYSCPDLFEIQTKEGRVIGYYYSILDNLTLRQDGNNYRLVPSPSWTFERRGNISPSGGLAVSGWSFTGKPVGTMRRIGSNMLWDGALPLQTGGSCRPPSVAAAWAALAEFPLIGPCKPVQKSCEESFRFNILGRIFLEGIQTGFATEMEICASV